MTYPAFVDLRSNIDQVYDQGSNAACGAHAYKNALEAQLDRVDPAQCTTPIVPGTRYSRAWFWWWVRVYQGFPASNSGTTVETARKTFAENGMVTEEAWPWDKAYTTPPDSLKPSLTGIYSIERSPVSHIDHIKRLLCHGVAPVLLFSVKTGIMSLANNKNWKTHDWDFQEGEYFGDHFVTIVGYDDESQRFLVENSWGPNWADGGFFGIPYSKIFTPGFYNNISHIDYIKGVKFKPVEGFMTVPYFLLPQESNAFVTASNAALKNLLVQSYATGSIQNVINTCKEWGVSDKHLEMIMKWERGTVRGFQEANPDIDWTGFVWNSI